MTPSNTRAAGPRLFLDSADPEQWGRLLPTGVFHGVTTNPLLLERAGQACTLRNLERLVRRSCELGAREIQLQTWGTDAWTMVAHGLEMMELAKIGPDVTIKVPATAIGWNVAGRLREAGAALTLTAVYTPGQVLAAAGLGAAYAAPYLGRMDDAGQDGAAVLSSMLEVLEGGNASTRLLVASLRSADRVSELAAAGFDTFTFGPAVANELLNAELTDIAAADFQRAAEAMPGD